MHTKLILLNTHPNILIFSPYITFTKRNGPYSISIYLICNGILFFWWTLNYLELFYKFLCQKNLILPILSCTSFLKYTKWPPPQWLKPSSRLSIDTMQSSTYHSSLDEDMCVCLADTHCIGIYYLLFINILYLSISGRFLLWRQIGISCEQERSQVLRFHLSLR